MRMRKNLLYVLAYTVNSEGKNRKIEMNIFQKMDGKNSEIIKKIKNI